MTDISTMSPDELRLILPSLTGDALASAKARLRAVNNASFEAQAAEWREKQMPKNMAQPAAVTIMAHRNGAPVSGGVSLLPERIPGYRMVAPGDVVAVDLMWPVVRQHLAKKVLEITSESPNRPLVYPSTLAAKVTKPTELARRLQSEPELVEQVLAQFQPVLSQICSQLEGSDTFADDFDARRAEAKIRAEEGAKDGAPKKVSTAGPNGTNTGGISQEEAAKISGGRRSKS